MRFKGTIEEMVWGNLPIGIGERYATKNGPKPTL